MYREERPLFTNNMSFCFYLFETIGYPHVWLRVVLADGNLTRARIVEV